MGKFISQLSKIIMSLWAMILAAHREMPWGNLAGKN